MTDVQNVNNITLNFNSIWWVWYPPF